MSDYGFVRIGAVSPKVHLANPFTNAEEIISYIDKARDQGCQLLVFPELSLTGYTCKDLFQQEYLRKEAVGALEVVRGYLPTYEKMIIIVGMPLVVDDQLFNVAVAMSGGKILCVVPKTHLPDYKEFEERRWFAPASSLRSREVKIGSFVVPIGTDILIGAKNVENFKIGIEICEDLWMPNPPSSLHALNGATVLVNLSASNDVVGKDKYRMNLVAGQSARCVAGYVYTSCGEGESTSDVVFRGRKVMADNGNIFAEHRQRGKFAPEEQMIIADLDVDRLVHERSITGSLKDDPNFMSGSYRTVLCEVKNLDVRNNLMRKIDPRPFVPSDPKVREEVCREIFDLQVTGLANRLEHVHNVIKQKYSFSAPPRVSLGLSGGLDSALAFLVAVQAFQRLEWNLDYLVLVTMPGYGTSQGTLKNAKDLCTGFGINLREIPISDIVTQHLRSIGHEPCMDCLVCENAQARQRTQILMDLGFVVGTGDLSEIMIGWCTYNGDQYAMYNVNCSIPKSLVRYVVEWYSDQEKNETVSNTLKAILTTPYSPELRKLNTQGQIVQKSEEINGPYEVIEFFFFHMLRHGASPEKIFFLAKNAWKGLYSEVELMGWLKNFYVRFANSQFKRNGAPDGVKVGSVSASQRGDLRIPSDVQLNSWLQYLDDGMEDSTY